MKQSSKVLTGIALSIAAGGALGILFAPDKGSETRKKLEAQLRKLSNGECSKERLEMVKSKLEKHRDRLEKGLQKINERLEKYNAET